MTVTQPFCYRFVVILRQTSDVNSRATRHGFLTACVRTEKENSMGYHVCVICPLKSIKVHNCVVISFISG